MSQIVVALSIDWTNDNPVDSFMFVSPDFNELIFVNL